MKITRQKLIWFEQIQEEIEKRMTQIADYIYRAKIPSNRQEEIGSIEVGNERFPGKTTSKKWIRSEYSYTTYPTELLWDDEALIRYRDEQDKFKILQIEQRKHEDARKELNELNRLLEKHGIPK